MVKFLFTARLFAKISAESVFNSEISNPINGVKPGVEGDFVFLSKTRNIKVYKFTIISAIDAVPSTAFLLL